MRKILSTIWWTLWIGPALAIFVITIVIGLVTTPYAYITGGEKKVDEIDNAVTRLWGLVVFNPFEKKDAY